MTVMTLDEDTRKQLIHLANIPHPDAPPPRNGIRFAAREAIGWQARAIAIVNLPWPVVQPRIVDAKPLAAALKMGSKDDPARLHFGDRQLTVTVGAPTLPLDDPDDDEGLPEVAIELTYLDDGDDTPWPVDAIERIRTDTYGQPTRHGALVVDSDLIAKVAKVAGQDDLRLTAPTAGVVWRAATPWSDHTVGYLAVTNADPKETADDVQF